MHPDRDVDPPVSRGPRLLLIALAIVGAILLVVSLMPKGMRTSSGMGTSHPGVGNRLEKLALEPMLNTEQWVKLDELRGKVTLINFWGPWCPPCLRELPEMLKLESKSRGRENVRVLLISYSHSSQNQDLDELRSDSLEALSRLKTDAPVYHDPEGQFIFQLMRTLKLEGFSFPTTILLDGGGTIRGVWTGYVPGYVGEMDAAIEKLSAEKQS